MKINLSFLIVTILMAFMFNFSFSQEKTNQTTRHLMSLKHYKKKYKEDFEAQKDSLKYIYRNGDTLVLLENYIKPKGISVPYEYKDSTFLNLYKKIAFNSKHDSLIKKTHMKYWKNDVKIYFSNSVSKKVKKELINFAKEISEGIDSLNIYSVKEIEDSNYIIYFFGDYEYKSNMKNYKNSDYFISWKDYKIFDGAIKLDSNKFFNDKLRIYELKKMLLGSLGHFKFSSELDCDSYFSDCFSENKTFSLLDKELLSYHYSYGICKGTDLETFEEQHKQAKETLKKHNHKMSFFHPYE